MKSSRLYLEHLPMLVDGLDSAFFAARMKLAGHGGDILRGSLLLLVLALAIAVSPISRTAVLAALVTYLTVDLIYLAARTPLLRYRRSVAQ